MSADTAPLPVDFDDIQGLVRYGYARLTQASFLLLRVRDPAAARAWLAQCPVNGAQEKRPPPRTALHVALSCPGLRALDVDEDIVQGFSPEFIAGMSGDESRARRLGDLGANQPSHWRWGGSPDVVPHLVVMLYAMPGELDAWQGEVLAQCEAGFEQVACLATTDMDGVEPFDLPTASRSRPSTGNAPVPRKTRNCGSTPTCRASANSCSAIRTNMASTPTARCSIRSAIRAARSHAPRMRPAWPTSDATGSYLVLRQLRQDVAGFWRFADGVAHGDAAARQHLAEAMVGRTMKGDPLVEPLKKGKDRRRGRPAQHLHPTRATPRACAARWARTSAAAIRATRTCRRRDGMALVVDTHARLRRGRTGQRPCLVDTFSPADATWPRVRQGRVDAAGAARTAASCRRHQR